MMNSHYSAFYELCLSELDSTGNPVELDMNALGTIVNAPGRESSFFG
jgi:hypothetical protein